MKKSVFTLIIIFFWSNTYSQKFDEYVVTNKNDTIYCKFALPCNIINATNNIKILVR